MANLELFKTILIIQFFYAFAITGIVHFLPAESLDYVTSFSDITSNVDLETVGQDFQSSLEQQTDIPLIELGALIFYSGNILIDLLLNFIFAIPEMIILFLNALLMLVSIDTAITNILQLFISVLMLVMYVIYVMEILLGLRSGQGVI